LLAWRSSFIFSCVFFILTVIFTFLESDGILPVSITCIVGVLSTTYLYFTKKFKVLFWIFAITGTVMSNFSMNYVMTSTHYVDFIWILTCILIAFIGLGKKVGYVFILVNCICVISYYLFTLNKLLDTISPKSYLGLFGELFELIFAFIVVAYLMSKFSEFQKMSEKEIEIANKENEVKTIENKVLVKEIHHRVKNNLQIIISLLRLQQNEIKSEETKKHFSEAINRIMVMSLIHQKLYRDKTLSQILIKDYLSELITDIILATALIENVDVKIESEVERVDLETIVPLGLLVNELVSNSLQHAFSNVESGIIKIGIEKRQEGAFVMTYFDNGVWKNVSENYSSFGTELIGILVSQLDGEYTRINNNEGTQYIFNLRK
jgi:two-component sensor histidine kinase